MPCWPLIHVKSCTNISTIIWKYILYIQITTKFYALGLIFFTIRDPLCTRYKQPLLNCEEECMTLIKYVNFWRNINLIKKLVACIFNKKMPHVKQFLKFFFKILFKKTILYLELNTVSILTFTILIHTLIILK